VDGTREPAIELVCGGILTWDIPQGASSFHVTLWRAETPNAIYNSQPLPNNPDSLRVLISLDGMPAADTVLHDLTPAETWTIPTNHAHTLSIQMEQEYGAFGLYLGDPGFSSQPVQAATVRHVLNQGEAYVNLGSGPRQGAFFDFHPGESVPIQAEFAGNAPFADVQILISLMQNPGASTISVRIPLQPEGSHSVGASQWQVPQMYGPANVQLLASLNGQQVYSNSAQVALAKAPDTTTVSAASIFGVHNSTAGSLFLQDEEVSLWGVKWARFFLNWTVIESTPGQYDWSYIDALVQSYSSQNLVLTGVFGELPPTWLTDPGQMRPAFSRFVNAALVHFKGKITVWSPYNEIDSKFYSQNEGFDSIAQPNGDILLLSQALQQIVSFDPSLIKVCCSVGSSAIMPYEKRLYDAGLIQWTDKTELHIYQQGPPEQSDFGMTYVEMVERLQQLTGMYGPPKQVWVTESNWLFEPAGVSGVFAPQITEHEQSQFLVRGALLSLGMQTPYFIHSPFFFPWHRDILVDSLASYAELTSLLSNGGNAHLLNLPQHVYGVTASTSAGTVVALWTDSQNSVAVRISGLVNYSIQDMYGNPFPSSGLLNLTGSPIYVIGQGTPSVTAVTAVIPQFISASAQNMLPPISTWQVANDVVEQIEGNGQVHITSTPSLYNRQITSPVFNGVQNHCYLISFPLVMHQGGIIAQIIMVNPIANMDIRDEYVYAFSGNDQYHPTYRFKTASASQFQLGITDSNPIAPAISDFEIGNVTLSDCP
jgi:hypothetical protein